MTSRRKRPTIAVTLILAAVAGNAGDFAGLAVGAALMVMMYVAVNRWVLAPLDRLASAARACATGRSDEAGLSCAAI